MSCLMLYFIPPWCSESHAILGLCLPYAFPRIWHVKLHDKFSGKVGKCRVSREISGSETACHDGMTIIRTCPENRGERTLKSQKKTVV